MSRIPTALSLVALGALGATTLAAVPATAQADASSRVVVNEIIYDKVSGFDQDRVELLNTGSETVDLTGWSVADDSKTETLPQGLSIKPGEFFVLTQGNEFTFGLGKGDAFTLFDATGAKVDGYAYEATAPLGTWARCPDGTGDWAHATSATPGAANVCSTDVKPGSVVLNEVDSGPADWVELYNPGDEPFALAGFELRDNSDDHRWRFPAGSEIAGGEFFVVEAQSTGRVFDDTTQAWRDGTFEEAIGIGSADKIRLYDASEAPIDDSGPWTGHAAINGDAALATLSRCPNGVGDFVLSHPTKGASNECVLPDIAINEIESNGDSTDWVEIINTGAGPIDIGGWTLMDNDPIGHAADVTPVEAGTTLEPGALFVFDGGKHFSFGLGKDEVASVRNASGVTVAEHSWADHANGVLARCPDGTGEFADVEVSTKGQLNACGTPARINEVQSQGDDWVELVNISAAKIDVGGLVVRDDDDAHGYTIPTGTEIGAGEYMLIGGKDLGFGLGKDDSVRLFDEDTLLDSTTWGPDHAPVTWGRCPTVTGPFANTAEATPGEANVCPGEIKAEVWPGSADVRALDPAQMFLMDSSGLDVQQTAEGSFLWVVDNGEGRFWKLNIADDGSVAFADGWDAGKRARFIADAGNDKANGPDSEGITVAGDGFLYLASERDNSAKGVNKNTVLKIDPNAPGPDVVASQEWDLTELLPQVSANLGMEAIEWVADEDLAGALFDRNTGAPYDPAEYPGHGDGLFFVAVEDGGQVFAVALNSDGDARIVSELKPGLGGVMALDWDTALGALWAVCDDGCDGTAAQFTLNGTETPDLRHFERPAGLPNANNEGFATGPEALKQQADATLMRAASAADAQAQRPAWWITDGVATNALHLGSLNAASETPVDPSEPGDPDNGENSDNGTAPGTDDETPAEDTTDEAGSADGGDIEGSVEDGELANTGAQNHAGVLGLAAILALLGLAVFVVSRRRHRLERAD